MDDTVQRFVDSFIVSSNLQLIELGLEPLTEEEENRELIESVARFMVSEELTEYSPTVDTIMKFIVSWELNKTQAS